MAELFKADVCTNDSVNYCFCPSRRLVLSFGRIMADGYPWHSMGFQYYECYRTDFDNFHSAMHSINPRRYFLVFKRNFSGLA